MHLQLFYYFTNTEEAKNDISNSFDDSRTSWILTSLPIFEPDIHNFREGEVPTWLLPLGLGGNSQGRQAGCGRYALPLLGGGDGIRQPSPAPSGSRAPISSQYWSSLFHSQYRLFRYDALHST